MIWCEGIIKTRQQKMKTLSAKGAINLSIHLAIVASSVILSLLRNPSFAQTPSAETFHYLEHSILISRHANEGSFIEISQRSHSINNDTPYDIDTYRLEDADPYYFPFDRNSCHVDPFSSSDKSSQNKQILAACLRNQLWENKNIALWIRATGATVLMGAAGSAGKVDDDLKLTLGFDKMDSILREWLGNKDP